MSKSFIYDYLFIGIGAANSLILINLYKNGLTKTKKIAIIEPDSKKINDKTFCFWSNQDELNHLNLNDIVSDSWSDVQINKFPKQSIAPLEYYRIQSLDLYNRAKQIIDNEDIDIFAFNYEGIPINEVNSFRLEIDNCIINSERVFDSRPQFKTHDESHSSHLYQSFFGWEIEIQDQKIDESTITMMDFDIPQNGFCQFMYVLPFSANRALFEVTRFGTEHLNEEEAELILSSYLQKNKYSIIDKEIGVIPMIPLVEASVTYGENWINTGSKANMIKPSTGYAFHAMAIDAKQISDSLSINNDIKRLEKSKRFEFYDRLLIDILANKPHEGKRIFETLFSKVSTPNVFSFLSEKTSIIDELFIFSKLPFMLFIKAAFKDLFSNYSSSFFSVLFVVFALLSTFIGYEKLPIIFLGIGFFTIGLSHGAVDHLTTKVYTHKLQFFKYILTYLLKGVMLGMVWIFWPDMALLVFVLYSAWHFGQADFMEWKISSRIGSFVWGLLVLLLITVFHLNETVLVLSSINKLRIVSFINLLTESQVLVLKVAVILISLFLAFYHKSVKVLITLLYLLGCAYLPLLVSFGVYFVLQHSMHGWMHLKSNLKIRSSTLWLNSLPFSIGGALLILVFTLIFSQKYLGVFFIILSCISIPHVISMDSFYRNRQMSNI